MKPIIETERLQLREMTEEDLPELSSLLQDRAVMYAYEHDFSDDDVNEWLARQQRRYESTGFGLWAIILTATGEFIGQAGLTLQNAGDGEEVLEVGYLLKHAHWHMGYATEAVSGCKRYAFEVLHAPRLCSIIKSDNIASQKVAKALGMKKVKEFLYEFYNGPVLHFLYEIKQ